MKNVFLLLFLSFATVMHSESITIKQKGGNETVLDLSSNPVITFSGENMVVINDFTTISFPLDDIDCYVVGEASTGIKDILEAPRLNEGHIFLKGMSKGMTANIYTLNGKKVGQKSIDESGIIDIFIGHFSKGAYLISTPYHKIKFINK